MILVRVGWLNTQHILIKHISQVRQQQAGAHYEVLIKSKSSKPLTARRDTRNLPLSDPNYHVSDRAELLVINQPCWEYYSIFNPILL